MRIAKKRLKTIDYLASEIANGTNFADSDVKAIIIALFDEIKRQMRENNYVIIDGFAVFRAKKHKGHSGSLKGKQFEIMTKFIPYCDFDDDFRFSISNAYPHYRPGEEPEKPGPSIELMADDLISPSQVADLPKMETDIKDVKLASLQYADNLLDKESPNTSTNN